MNKIPLRSVQGESAAHALPASIPLNVVAGDVPEFDTEDDSAVKLPILQ